jgi:hypothetical protein
MANTLKLGAGKWATGKDTVLSFNDENGNFKPLPFSFSRASSATVVNQSGLIETVGSGEPRIDFLGNTKGALLLEPSRTNIVEYSEDGTQWNTINSTVSLTTDSTSPSSQSSVYKVNDDANDAQHRVDVRPSVTNGTQYTFSAFVKQESNSDVDFVYLLFSSKFSTTRFYFNIEEGTSLDSGGIIENYGNGWYKISGSATANSSGNGVLGVNLANADNNNTYSGTGNGSIFVWGLQLESNASYATSYIPTSGSAVTRVAESDVSLSNLPIFDYTVEDFSISFKITNKNFDSVFSRVLSKASTSSGYEVFIENNGAIYFRTVASGVGVFSYTNPNQIVLGVESNITITRSGAVGKIYKDGIEITSVYANHSNISSSSSNNLRLGSYVQSGYNFSGQIKDVKLYNTALTDQELIALTQV